jgi:dihydrolipoamide dehydrogenase
MSRYDVAVIGGGPGGYVAAIRCAQLGMRVAVIERDAMGGLCLNWGCIPSKSLLRNAEVIHLFKRAADWGVTTGELALDFNAAVRRSRGVVNRMVKGIEYLMKKNNIDVIKGSAVIRRVSEIEVQPQGETVEADRIIVATGARNRVFPNMPIDGKTVITSTEGMVLSEAPGKVILVGGGPVGVEFAYVYWAYGAEVTIIEMMDHLLPSEDPELSEQLERQYGKYGIKFLTKTKVESIEVVEGQAKVRVTSPSGAEELAADTVLVGIGFQGNTEGIGLESVGVQVERGFIPVGPDYRTNVPGIWAIGDVTGPPLLAHVAMAEGVIAAEDIAGQSPPPLDYIQMPRATYCQPQVASIGFTEEAATGAGRTVKVGRFPFRANGKALALGDYEGFVKVIIDAQTEEFLGVHLVGPDVTELLGEVSLARTLEATPVELGLAVHPHPTLSEVIKEAALAARGEAIHV